MGRAVNVPKFEGNERIGWIEREIPEPGVGQLLLEVKANALCGSDRAQFYHGSDVTPGHEASGVVVQAGAGTVHPVGTPGVVFLMDFCGKCRNCLRGATNQCLNKRADMGFNRDGGYGKYMLVNENIFFPIPDNLPLTEATLLLDVMGTGGHAIKRAELVHADIQSVLVSGAGPIGLGVLAMAKILLGSAIPVFITDMIPYRLDLAKRLGGLPIQLKDQTLQEGLHAYGVDGVDAAIDTTGKTMARKANLDALHQRGVLICVGHGEGLELEVSSDLIATERAVLGSEYFCYNEIATNLVHLQGNFDYLTQIITHRFGVEHLEEAYQLFLHDGRSGKVVIEQ